MDAWRLLLTGEAHGAWNMALDETLLEGMGRCDSLPIMRLYAWGPPCLSLGYAQPIADVDLPRLKARGWDLVRRPTGGRAVLHTDELTYAVIAPINEPRVAGSVLTAYSRLAQALAEALHLLGLPAELQANTVSGKGRINPVCFESASNYEISVAGKKLIGSAQARRKDGVLQHGSLPLTGDLTRILQVLAFPDDGKRAEAAARLTTRAATVESVLGRRVSWDEAAQAFISAFGQVFSLDLKRSDLSVQEKARAEELMEEKYAHPL